MNFVKLPPSFRKPESRLPNANIFASALKRTPNSQRRLLLKADDDKDNNCSSPPEAIATASSSNASPLVLRVSTSTLEKSTTFNKKHPESLGLNNDDDDDEADDEPLYHCTGHCETTHNNEENNKNRLNNVHCQCNNKAAISPTAYG